jgi:hypothetical protein
MAEPPPDDNRATGPDDKAEKKRISPGKALAITGAVLAAAGTAIGILFQVDPRLQPCLGGTSASITVTVIPMSAITYDQYHGYALSGVNPSNTNGTLNRKREVKWMSWSRSESRALVADTIYTLNTSDFRGHTLQIAYSILPIDRHGAVGTVTNYRVAGAPFVPTNCTDQRGFDIPIQNLTPTRTYKLLLEVFDQTHTAPLLSENRITYTESNTFRLAS